MPSTQNGGGSTPRKPEGRQGSTRKKREVWKARHREYYDKNYSSMMTAITQARYITDNLDDDTGARSSFGFIWNPFSISYNVWLAFTIVAAAFTGWFEIYMMAFADRPGLYPPADGKCIIEYILFIIFGLDMLLHFRVAIWDGDQFIKEPKEIAKIYGSGRFLVDLLSVIPFDYIVLGIMGKQDATQSETRGVSALKLLRVLRMYRLRYFFDFLAVHPAVSYSMLVITRNYTIVFYVVHFAACMLFFIARLNQFSPASWVGQNTTLFTGKSQAESYLISFYWAMTTLTSVGYGDLHPYTVPEMAFTIIYQALLFSLTAYLMGSITNLVIKSDFFTGRYHDRLKNLMQFVRTHNLSKNTEQSLADHLRLHMGSEANSDEQILSIYPSAIRKEVLRQMYWDDMKDVYLFQGCPKSLVDRLISDSRIEMYMPDVAIIQQSESVDHLYVLVQGMAELTSAPPRPGSSLHSVSGSLILPRPKHDEDLEAPSELGTQAYTEPTELKDGDVFGELAFFMDDTSLDTVTTKMVCRVLAIPRKAYLATQAAMPEACEIVIQNLYDGATRALQRQDEMGIPLALRSTVYGSVTPGGLQRQFSSAVSDGASVHRGLSVSRRGFVMEQRRLLKLQLAKVKSLLERLQAQRAALALVPGPQDFAPVPIPKRSPTPGRGGVVTPRGITMPVSPAARVAEMVAAAAAGDVDGVQQVLGAGLDVDAASIGGRTALMVASSEGHPNVVSVLLAAGADCNASDRHGRTPLLEAALNGYDVVMDRLMAAGARLGQQGVDEGMELCQLAHGDKSETMRRLLRAGAHAGACDYDLRTPLHIAASEGNLAMVQLLVEEGHAPLESKDRWGRSPLDEARIAGQEAVVAYLEQAIVYVATLAKSSSHTSLNQLGVSPSSGIGSLLSSSPLMGTGSNQVPSSPGGGGSGGGGAPGGMVQLLPALSAPAAIAHPAMPTVEEVSATDLAIADVGAGAAGSGGAGGTAEGESGDHTAASSGGRPPKVPPSPFYGYNQFTK